MTWHAMTAKKVQETLETDIKNGLNSAQVLDRQSTYGKNELKAKKGRSMIMNFFAQFNDFMIIILLIAAAVSFFVSMLKGELDFVDPAIILIIVMVNAIIGVVQEARAEKAIEALKKMTAPSAKVIRDGRQQTIEATELVPGDIILLEAGDYVPADARLITSINMKTDEASLTGESCPVEKAPDMILHDNTIIGDQINMLLATTIVTSGRGEAIVTSTGMNTQVGQIADLIMDDKDEQTPLQKKLAKTGEILGNGALMICGAIFIMGLLRRMPVFDMFMESVSLAVAAIPEGLPAIVTIVLAIGVQRMARKNAIVRNLPAVETLGCASVICSDKTGTLTQNKMTVQETAMGDASLIQLLSTLCNNASYGNGDPTETALIKYASKNGIAKEEADSHYPRVLEIPFDSNRKLMTTVHQFGNRYKIITKGAPDVLLELCRDNLSDSQYREILVKNTQMADRALRVLAVAYRDCDSKPSGNECEENLTFAGLIGMIDPPRPEVPEAIKTCKKAGIRPVMITGDHISTAIAIAKEIGLMHSTDKAITGAELNNISDSDLIATIYDYSVFARVSPEHKMRIVKAFKERGAVVAMTGDGVNDAPALKTADIGCAMGKGGTDVAKGAADMILTDDNFATIVSAVREGRGIYDNIKRCVHFLLSSNIGEIICIFVAILLGWSAPLIAIQLLWVNLVTDSLPAIALGLEQTEKTVMDRKPQSPKKSMFSDGMGFSIAVEGAMIGILTLIAFNLGRNMFDITVGRTMAFAVLSLSEIVHAFNMRSDHSVFSVGFFSNKYLNWAFVACASLQVSVITIPHLAGIFKVVCLNSLQWLIVLVLSVAPLILLELQKLALKNE